MLNITSKIQIQTHEIRKTAIEVRQLQKFGLEINLESIGDPFQKGGKIPCWIKDILFELMSNDKTFGYVDTRGVPETRYFLAEKVNKRGGCEITMDDIVFFSGIGNAITKISSCLKNGAKVIIPSPVYPIYASMEFAHLTGSCSYYRLDPRDWMPDVKDIENKIRSNNSIVAILLINPHNPTGIVYTRSCLERIVDIARQYDLFLICDEIFAHVVYDNVKMTHLSEVIAEVPGIALRGLSKEYPWPGARCGWMEIFNQNRCPAFKQYIDALINSQMLEVCSTSLPQYSIPLVMGDFRYWDYLGERAHILGSRRDEAIKILSDVKWIHIIKPQGGFYITALFDDNILSNEGVLSISNSELKMFVEAKTQNVKADKRFMYYLVGATGICIAPLSDFYCDRNGFRITLLEENNNKRRNTLQTIAKHIKQYITSVQ